MSQVTTALIGGLVGLLPVALAAVISWGEKQGLQARQDRALGLAQKRVAFLSAWWGVQQSVCSPAQLEEVRRNVSAELEQLKQGLHDVLTEIGERQRAMPGRRNAVQRLLLAYTPRSGSAWLWHTLFYVMLGMTVFMVGVAISTKNYLGFAVLEIPAALLLLLFRALARRADRRTAAAERGEAPPLAAEGAKARG